MIQKYSIGIDIGGTNTVYGIVNTRGDIVSKGSMSTTISDNVIEYTKLLGRAIKEMMRRADISPKRVVGVGIGAPCANFTTGVIEAATDLPWPSPIPLKDLMEKELELPVRVTNDANAATIGEMYYGSARGMANFLMITLGTGVGSGIVCNGQLLTGSRGFAGELGHCSVREGRGRLCGCGRKDCLQNYASAKGVVLTALDMMDENQDIPSLMRDITRENLTAKDVYEAALKGDTLALRTFEYTGEVLGRSCADFASFSDPEAIILFGGVAGAFEFIYPAMRRAMEENILHLYRDRIRILRSGLEASEAAVLGASALVWLPGKAS